MAIKVSAIISIILMVIKGSRHNYLLTNCLESQDIHLKIYVASKTAKFSFVFIIETPEVTCQVRFFNPMVQMKTEQF